VTKHRGDYPLRKNTSRRSITPSISTRHYLSSGLINSSNYSRKTRAAKGRKEAKRRKARGLSWNS